MSQVQISAIDGSQVPELQQSRFGKTPALHLLLDIFLAGRA
jgi:hypothetical protein